MDIAIPDEVQFHTEVHHGGTWIWKDYCFAHAVLRALEGEKIKTKLIDDYSKCDDCTDFGEPNHHDLTSLRLRRMQQ